MHLENHSQCIFTQATSPGLLVGTLCETVSAPEGQEGWPTATAARKTNPSATDGNRASLTRLALDKPRLTLFLFIF